MYYKKHFLLSSFLALIIGFVGLHTDAQAQDRDHHNGLMDRDNGQKVSGTIIDEATGEALSDVEVYLTEREEERATTDEEGRFEIEGVEPGNYTIRVEGEGFEEHQQMIEVQEGEEAEEVEINLRSGLQAPGQQPGQEQPMDQEADAPQPGDQDQDDPTWR